MPREQRRAPTAVERTDLGADLAQLGGIGGDAEIAQGGKDMAAADRIAVDARENRFRNVANERLKFVDRQDDDAAAIILPLVGRLVAAGEEILVTRPGQDDRTHGPTRGRQVTP